VHHINGVKTDNRIENLSLLPSDIAHLPLTYLQQHIKRLEKELLKYKEKFGEL